MQWPMHEGTLAVLPTSIVLGEVYMQRPRISDLWYHQ